jgi:hypothetical protein
LSVRDRSTSSEPWPESPSCLSPVASVIQA